jgi:long-chain acyl-CoA synthetase
MEEKSKEDFPRHSDGKVWFHTGDIGVMTETGALKIVDRKKDLIKLSGGEYVSLGKVEAALKQVSGIGACVVFAKSDKDHCVTVVSQPEKGWASVGGKPEADQLVTEIDKKLRSMGLARFEIPSKVKLDDAVWTPETGLVTASLKVQRNPLRSYYNEEGGLLDQMSYKFPEA